MKVEVNADLVDFINFYFEMVVWNLWQAHKELHHTLSGQICPVKKNIKFPQHVAYEGRIALAVLEKKIPRM